MAFNLDEERTLLSESLARLLDTDYSFAKRRSICESKSGYSREIWRSFADMGLLGAPFDKVFGGGGNFLNTLVIMSAFGRSLVIEPYIPTVILAGGVLRHGGSIAQQSRFIPEIIAGDAIWALATSEPRSRYNVHSVQTRARPDGPDYLLSGEKIAVLGGAVADRLLVTARTSNGRRDKEGVTIFLVNPDAPGVTRTDYPTVDNMCASDFIFSQVRVGQGDVVGEVGGGEAIVAKVIDEATVAQCAEAVGAMEVLNEKVVEHCRSRMIFGQPLAKFQVVQHRLVDMRAAYEYARAMTEKAYADLDKADEKRMATVSAAKVLVAKEAGLVAREAVQLHGAMGVSDELDIGHYFRRLAILAGQFGDADFHIRRYIKSAADAPRTAAAALELAAELDELGPDDIAFRDRIRNFYADNLDDELRHAGDVTLWNVTAFPFSSKWQKILHTHGFGAPDWPVEYGGCDWTPSQRIIWSAETARARPPLILSMGKNYVGPCIMKFGTDEQKAFFLPRILSGEDWWAQGYSEPGAGSDLASLQLSAVSDGDDYLLNGSKIWTTFAHEANRIFCLVRTSNKGRKQQGITFLLIDMDIPGIEIHPIINLAGDHDLNQVFFTNVRVPKSCRLGEENEGWKVARHLLQFEHGTNLARLNMENIRRLGWLREIAAIEDDGTGGRLIDDADFSRQIAEVDISLQAVDFVSRRQPTSLKKSAAPGAEHELFNIRAKEIAQTLTELAVRAVGDRAIVHQPSARDPFSRAEPIGPQHAVYPMPLFLIQRGLTIAGGTPEIHRGNLAKHLLHL